MAAEGRPQQAIPPDIYYRCHPNKLNSTIVCVVCSNSYHKSDFNRKLEGGKARYVDSALVLCDEHGLDLTSNEESATRVVIIKLKDELRNKCKLIENLSKNYQILEKEYSNLKADSEARLQEENMQIDESKLNDTVYEEKDDGILSALKTENKLLRELNTELKHKNLLLNELIEKEKERPNTFKETYANTTAKKIHTFQTKKIPKIVVKRKNKSEKSIIKEHIFHYLLKDKTI